MKQNQIFFHGTDLNLTTYHFLSKNVKLFQWLSKSKFLSFMIKMNPNNGNETEDIISWYIFKSEARSLFIKNIKVFQWLSKLKFIGFMTKVNPDLGNETKDILSFFHIQIWSHISFFSQKIKYFSDVQNQNFSVLWLKWTQTMEMEQNQTFFHGKYSNLTSYVFFIKKILKYFNDFQNHNLSISWLKGTQT